MQFQTFHKVKSSSAIKPLSTFRPVCFKDHWCCFLSVKKLLKSVYKSLVIQTTFFSVTRGVLIVTVHFILL